MASTVCKQCGKAVPSADVRYVSANTFLCVECYDGSQGRIRGDRGMISHRQHYDANPVQKESLVCAKCDFVSRFRPDAENKICGYCGSKDLREEQSSAASLLAQADEIDSE